MIAYPVPRKVGENTFIPDESSLCCSFGNLVEMGPFFFKTDCCSIGGNSSAIVYLLIRRKDGSLYGLVLGFHIGDTGKNEELTITLRLTKVLNAFFIHCTN